ncbi:MAG: MATE family efflux transporter [Gammaproteobacteria bacterium]|nr:MATE family efflux transporter [Gammaproteobacteria bacterium]
MNLNRRVWSLSAPMMLSNISLPLLGLVDTAVMGHMETAVYLAAVSVGAMILHFIFWGFGFLRMSTVGLAAQAYGADDGLELRYLILRAAVFALLIAALLIVSRSALIDLALYFVQPGAAVSQLSRQYFDIRIWAAPATLLSYVLLGWLLGVQRARAVLAVMLFVNILNIILDLVFVLGLGWHVEGVAWASLLAEFSGLLLALWLVRKSLICFPAALQWQDVFQWQAFIGLARMNLNIYIRTISLLFVFAFFTTQSARAGDVVVAANAILLQFLTFMAYLLDAYAHAAEAMVGEAIGEKNAERLKAVVMVCLKWSFWSALLFAVLYLVAGQQIIALLSDIKEVRDYSSSYRLWLAALPLIAVWSYLFDGVFVGATWSREMRDVMLIAVFLVFLPAWVLTQGLENHGLWLSMSLFLAARGALMAWYYRKKTA